MQSNKFDNQIREKLNARTIEPNAKSWDRLDAMLSVQEEKKPRKGFLWLYIAASFFVFFGLGVFLFNSDKNIEINTQNPVLVAVDKTIDSVEKNKAEEILIESQQPVVVQNEINLSKSVNSIKEKTTIFNKSNSVQENDNKANPTYNLQPTTSSAYKYISPENLLAEVQNEKKNLSSESNVSKKRSVKIDANALLSKVEKELDESYRETTLDKLNKNFNAVKSAIVNRNYE
ncbi:hypothetical protein [Flavobacterium psychraquaticum]|uniref:hypothetical protein n=1 Tax=Flavobacterium psychraquaticum TaxID=3103958 RepID=UPI002ACD6BA3|nr:hypothetical protein [Flavobacterium sp. LB-N7T]